MSYVHFRAIDGHPCLFEGYGKPGEYDVILTKYGRIFVGLHSLESFENMRVIPAGGETAEQAVARLVEYYDPDESKLKLTIDTPASTRGVLCVTNRKEVGEDWVLRDEEPDESVRNQLGLMVSVPIWEYFDETVEVIVVASPVAVPGIPDGLGLIPCSGMKMGDLFDMEMCFPPAWDESLLCYAGSKYEYSTLASIVPNPNFRDEDGMSLIVGGRSVWSPTHPDILTNVRTLPYIARLVYSQDVTVTLTPLDQTDDFGWGQHEQVSAWLSVQLKSRNVPGGVAQYMDLDIPGEIPYSEDEDNRMITMLRHVISCCPDTQSIVGTTVTIRDLEEVCIERPDGTFTQYIPEDGFSLVNLIHLSCYGQVPLPWLGAQLCLPEYDGVAGSEAAVIAKAFHASNP
jgi:hypothetical protein